MVLAVVALAVVALAVGVVGVVGVVLKSRAVERPTNRLKLYKISCV